MPSYDKTAIRQAVGANAYAAGQAYQRQGRVSLLEVQESSRGHCAITARVKGSTRAPYRVDIQVDPGGRGSKIEGDCSCPVGYNCKHVAATLLAAQEAGPRLGGPRLGGSSRPIIDAAPSGAGSMRPARDRLAKSGLSKPAWSSLPDDVASWLNRLEQAERDASEEYPEGVRKRLLYLVDVRNTSGMPHQMEVSLATVEIRRDGRAGPAQATNAIFLSIGANAPRYLRPSDRAIVRQLRDLGTYMDGGRPLAAMLRRIVGTGRGRWRRPEGIALREGAPRPGHLHWVLDDDGAQRLRLDAGDALPLLLGEPMYVDAATGETGALELPLPSALLDTLLSAPALAPEVAAHFGAELNQRLPSLAVPPPAAVAPPEIVRDKPVPCLELFGAGDDPVRGVARLGFRYRDLPVPGFKDGAAVTLRRNGRLYRVERSRTAEKRAAIALHGLGLEYADILHVPGEAPLRHVLTLAEDEDDGWIGFMLHDVPALREQGWQVTIDPGFPMRLARMEGDFEAELRDGSARDRAEHENTGTDWFEFHLGAVVDGERIDLVPALLRLIESGGADAMLRDPEGHEDALVLLPLPDGRQLVLPGARLRPILATLLELHAGGGAKGDGTLGVEAHDAALLAELDAASQAAGLVWQGGEALRALGRALREQGGAIPPIAVPEQFLAALRPYQQRGVDWMGFLGQAGLGAVLADDMGLGKTIQALAHLCVEHEAGRLAQPALVVCPTSLVPNWRAEAARFAPHLRVLTWHGSDRRQALEGMADHDLVITTYPLLFRDGEALLIERDWSVVLLDEAQSIKNPAARTGALARKLRARQRIALTGTPLENHLGELWSLFDWVQPGFLATRQRFGRAWRTPIEKNGDTARRDMLANRVRPFLLRRTKAEVATELPPRTDLRQPVEFEPAQRAVYEGIRLTMHAKVTAAIAERGLARSGIVILEALLKLRQACCDPRLLKLAASKKAQAGSAKLERLMELVPTLVEDGRRILIFSQFTSMLALIAEALDAARLDHLLLTGKTKDRATPVRRFQAGEVPIFLISLKAGGVGLNLTAADTVIHYDPWWNPAVEDQATDRAHRIGQDKPVFVHRLVAIGTVEERMEELKARKQALARGILDGGDGETLALSEGDVEMLLGPG